MKKSTVLLSLLLILGGLCTQSQLFAMGRDTTRERLQKKVKQKNAAEKEEKEKLQKCATMLLLEKKFVKSAEQYAQATEALKEADQKTIRAFGNENTIVHPGENSEQDFLSRKFYLKKPEQIAHFLQHPKTLDANFCFNNPEFIQRLLESTEPEIQELGRVASSIGESERCNLDYMEKLETLKGLIKKANNHETLKKSNYIAEILKLSREYYSYILSNTEPDKPESEKVKAAERKYYQELQKVAARYKELLPTTNSLYEATIAQIRRLSLADKTFTFQLGTTTPLPASLQPSLEPEKLKPTSSSASAASSYAVITEGKSHRTATMQKSKRKKRKQKQTTAPPKYHLATEEGDTGTEVVTAKVTTQEKAETPEVTEGAADAVSEAKVSESTAGTSKVLAIPASIKPKLPTQDGSQIVGDLGNPYFVTIKHSDGKYLFYKPTTSSSVSLAPPQFTYHSRVQKYIDNPDQALEQDGFTERCSASILAKIKALKAFPHAADWLLRSLGVKDTFTDKHKRTIPRLTLMGQIQPKNAKPIDGVFQWGFIPRTQTCYHRSGTEKVPAAMIEEYQQRQFNVEFPPLPDNGNDK